jgi:hypothetical protein
MAQISSFDNYIKRDNRRKCRNKCKNIVKLSIDIIHIKNPSIISEYKDGDRIRKLFNAAYRTDSMAIKAKHTYDDLLVEFSNLHKVSSIDKAPTSNIIEDFQLAIDEAKIEMLKTALDAAIQTEKLNEARQLEKNQYRDIDCINCHELEKTFF